MRNRFYRTCFCLLTGLVFWSFVGADSVTWGFFAHKKINRFAVFALPPQMMVWYKPRIEYITSHAPDPDKRRYAVKGEAAHHYIDIDYFGVHPYSALPRQWKEAVQKYSEDTLQAYGTVPWHALDIFYRLQHAFENEDGPAILKYSTYLGHYIADAAVPLHASSNYNGQLTGQKGIHALWETEIPEMLADTAFNLWTGKAKYVDHPGSYIWDIVLESALAADTVLRIELHLLKAFPPGEIHAYVDRKGKTVRRHSPKFIKTYNKALNGMVERRMRRSILAISSLWYTAWINAGQPDLNQLNKQTLDLKSLKEVKKLDKNWHNADIKRDF